MRVTMIPFDDQGACVSPAERCEAQAMFNVKAGPVPGRDETLAPGRGEYECESDVCESHLGECVRAVSVDQVDDVALVSLITPGDVKRCDWIPDGETYREAVDAQWASTL